MGLIGLMGLISLIGLIHSRHRVVAAAAPRMATQDAAHGKVEPFDGTVAAQRLNGVLRASGGEAARRGREGRNKTLVEPYRRYQQQNKKIADFLNNKVHAIS